MAKDETPSGQAKGSRMAPPSLTEEGKTLLTAQRGGRMQESVELAWRHNYDILARAMDFAKEAEAEFGWHPGDIYPYIERGMVEAFVVAQTVKPIDPKQPKARRKRGGPSNG